jgi:hypothetical protein
VIELVVTQRNAFREFVEAVLDLSEDQDAETVERYLAASRLLDESRQHSPLGQRSPATKNATAKAA